MARARNLPRLAYNWLTALGAALAVVAALTFGLLLIAQLTVAEAGNPYFGIFLYGILPTFLVLGLLLIPLGMWRARRRGRHRAEPESLHWPVLDLSQRAQRNAVLVFLGGTVVLLLVGAVGSYGFYHHSESVSFCGETCHEVMEPEYTTYQNSPHARVACTKCHVGPGADWFVRSKLSGAYQVYAALADKYPRPIPTPIESLRPAQETCEQCHWPEKTFGAQQRLLRHYMYDEQNTEWPISLLIKTGGGDSRTGQEEGIHWHMNIGVEVEYIARDEKRRDIPFVRVTDRRTGRETVYQHRSRPLSAEEIAAAVPRVMDCMDCHNRPSHIFRSPDEAIDQQILVGRIDPSVPFVKRTAVKAMGVEAESREDALERIANEMTEFYRGKQADFYAAHKDKVDDAILATQDAYARNIFPAMRTDWADYPNNIGHFESIGCMRCHGGEHVAEDGTTVTRDCDACHIILAQGAGDLYEMAGAEPGLTFRHPEDIGEVWLEMGCYECHTGTRP